MAPHEHDDVTKAITSIGLQAPSELTVMITTGCNLCCHHCWPQAEPVSKAVYISPVAIDSLVDNFSRMGVHNFCITGGEPLTHPNFDQIITSVAGKDEVKQIYLQTNGTTLSPDHIDLFNVLPHHKICFQISLEGARPKIHDTLRDKQSFEKVFSGLLRLVEIGLGPNITVAFTETQSNIQDLPDLLDLLEKLGVGKLVSGCIVKRGRARKTPDLLPPRPDQYIALLNRYKYDSDFHSRYERMGNFAAIEWHKGKDYPRDDTCQCMQTPYVTATGNLYPCKMLPIERWRIDGIFDRPFDEVTTEMLARWRNIPGIYRQRRQIPACHSCVGNSHCGGGCLGRIIDVENGCTGPEDRCELRQAVYRWRAI